MNADVVMYSTRFCPYCVRARQLLDSKKIVFSDIEIDAEPAQRREMMQRSGRRTVPQIWIGEQHIGGYDDLAMLEMRGRLDELLNAAHPAPPINSK